MPLANKERQTFFFPPGGRRKSSKGGGRSDTRQKNLQVVEQQNGVGINKIKNAERQRDRNSWSEMNRINVGGLFNHMGAMDPRPGGQREADSPDSAKAIFKNAHEDCECVVTSLNFGVKAIFYKHNRCLM